MATVRHSKKACAVNPLKMSQPIGGALAFLGLADTMPILHGSQGCTAFGMVLFVRHFKESIPLQTTAMSEVATVLGGFENVEQAVMNIHSKSRPAIIGMCSTGLTETKGDDVEGYLKLISQRHPELADTALIYVSTPDFKGAFQDGWAATVLRILQVLVEAPGGAARNPRSLRARSGVGAGPVGLARRPRAGGFQPHHPRRHPARGDRRARQRGSGAGRRRADAPRRGVARPAHRCAGAGVRPAAGPGGQ
jgi:nitrogenase molybdenum-iron protein NifN